MNVQGSLEGVNSPKVTVKHRTQLLQAPDRNISPSPSNDGSDDNRGMAHSIGLDYLRHTFRIFNKNQISHKRVLCVLSNGIQSAKFFMINSIVSDQSYHRIKGNPHFTVTTVKCFLVASNGRPGSNTLSRKDQTF